MHACRSTLEDPTAKLGLQPKKKETARTRELRNLVVRALAVDAEHAPTLQQLEKLGRAYVGADSDHKIHDDACPRDLQDVAVYAAVRAGGDALFDQLAEHLKTEQDGRIRLLLLRALGAVDDDKRAQKARELALDPRLRANEVFQPLFQQAGDPRTRDATWAWFAPHVEVLAGKLPPEWGGDALYRVFEGDCTAEKAQQLATFFAGKKLPGGPRPVEQLVEAVRQCDARRTAHEASARSYF